MGSAGRRDRLPGKLSMAEDDICLYREYHSGYRREYQLPAQVMCGALYEKQIDLPAGILWRQR